MTVFYRRPRTRKMRILKKWMKDPRNWKPDPNGYMVNGNIFCCHPQTAAKIRKALAEKDSLFNNYVNKTMEQQ